MQENDATTAFSSTQNTVVVGVGGGGSNAVNRMIATGLAGVEFVAINTDQGGLARSLAPEKVAVGGDLPNGRDAGGDPVIGRAAVRGAAGAIKAALGHADLVGLVVGEGGGTGSGGAPLVTQIAKGMGARVVAVVTRPFSFEGRRRGQVADEAIDFLRGKVDDLVIVPLDSLLAHTAKSKMTTAFDIADLVLLGHVESVVRPPGARSAAA